jgi:hypothetical protein
MVRKISKAPNPLMIRVMSPCSSLSLVIPHTINSKIHAIKIVKVLMTAGKMAIYLPATAEVVAICIKDYVIPYMNDKIDAGDAAFIAHCGDILGELMGV